MVKSSSKEKNSARKRFGKIIVVKKKMAAWIFRSDIMCQECSHPLPTGQRGSYRSTTA